MDFGVDRASLVSFMSIFVGVIVSQGQVSDAKSWNRGEDRITGDRAVEPSGDLLTYLLQASCPDEVSACT